MDTPEIHIWLGLPGSDRRKLLHDVTFSTRTPNESTLFLIGSQEPASDIDFKDVPSSIVHTFEWQDDHFVLDGFPEETPSQIFWLMQGNENPVDQLEALKAWLEERQWTLTRVVTVVSGRLLEEHPKLKAYYEACIHFSDMVLITQREGLPANWSRKFTQKYEKERYPCLFEQVKNNRVKNPGVVLDPLPRRMSQFFDSLEEALNADVVDFTWESDDDFADDEEEDPIPEDPFLARNLSGERKFRIPELKSIFP